jgi:magnesium-protoporphyrin IX monomethyl ester (oxidative) cyclase
VFPITLDLDHPAFKAGLDRLVALERAIAQAKEQGGFSGRVNQAALAAMAAVTFARLYVLPAKSNALPAEIRLAPVW